MVFFLHKAVKGGGNQLLIVTFLRPCHAMQRVPIPDLFVRLTRCPMHKAQALPTAIVFVLCSLLGVNQSSSVVDV